MMLGSREIRYFDGIVLSWNGINGRRRLTNQHGDRHDEIMWLFLSIGRREDTPSSSTLQTLRLEGPQERP